MDPITGVLGVGMEFIKRFFPDPKQKAEATQKLLEMQMNGDLAVIAAQTEINKIEAASTNWFIAGWRPAVGWVCVFGLAFTVFSPLLVWIAGLAGYSAAVAAMPAIPVNGLMTLLIGMLGLGGMRTVEKLQGAEKNR